MNLGPLRTRRSFVSAAALALLSFALLALPATSLGAGPEGRFEPKSWEFKSTPGKSTAPFTFYLESTGTEPLIVKEDPVIEGPGGAAYVISNSGAFSCEKGQTVKPGQACGISVSFKPPAVGTYEAELLVSTNGASESGGVYESKLLGIAKEEEEKAAALELTPNPFSFGEQLVGAGGSEPQPFTIEHVGGGGPVKIKSVQLSGPEFEIVEPKACLGVELALGKACTVEVRFKPVSVGKKEATLEVEAEGGEAGFLEASSKLSGTGVQGKPVVVPGEWKFGEVKVGSGSVMAFLLRNEGTGPLTVEEFSLVGLNAGEFHVISNSCKTSLVLKPVESCGFEVEFKPESTGEKLAKLLISTSAGAVEVPLRGTGV